MPETVKGVAPHIAVDNGVAAIDFYKKAFGAIEVTRAPYKDGRVMHAELQINGGTLYLHDDFPEMAGGKKSTPKSFGGTAVTLHMNVDNCDAWFKRAIEAGATETLAPSDQFWGARYAQVTDPFGHRWALMHPLPGAQGSEH